MEGTINSAIPNVHLTWSSPPQRNLPAHPHHWSSPGPEGSVHCSPRPSPLLGRDELALTSPQDHLETRSPACALALLGFTASSPTTHSLQSLWHFPTIPQLCRTPRASWSSGSCSTTGCWGGGGGWLRASQTTFSVVPRDICFFHNTRILSHGQPPRSLRSPMQSPSCWGARWCSSYPKHGSVSRPPPAHNRPPSRAQRL